MSRLAEEMDEFYPTKPYIGLELRMVPNAEDVYNITGIKKYNESGEVIKDYGYSDFETPYYGTEEAKEKARKICGVLEDDIRIQWGNY